MRKCWGFCGGTVFLCVNWFWGARGSRDPGGSGDWTGLRSRHGESEGLFCNL